MQNSDPDYLQMLDECDAEWVMLWKKALDKKCKQSQIDLVSQSPWELAIKQ